MIRLPLRAAATGVRPATAAPYDGSWNCNIGISFSMWGDPLTSLFYLLGEPLKSFRIRRPSEAMMYMDTHIGFSRCPLYLPFDRDVNGDGMVDSNDSFYSLYGEPFNGARPTVHNDGCNVILLDGHVERVSFKKLWQVDRTNQVIHPFWHLED